jgi:predicted O-linked N-acetylglucosamine transferase (SPINDLY family)
VLLRIVRQWLGGARTRGVAPPLPSAEAAGDGFAEALRLQQSGHHAEAAAACRAMLARNADEPETLNLLAAALCAQGALHEGLECLRRVKTLLPQSADTCATLAAVLASSGEIDAAIEEYRCAVRLRPDLRDTWRTLTGLLQAFGRYDEAESGCSAALAAHPHDAVLHHTRASALFEQGRVPEAIDEARAALACSPELPGVRSDLARMLSYVDGAAPDEVYRELRAWAERYAEPLERAAAPHANTPEPQRRLRIGYVSPYFRKHAVTFFFETVIQHHDRAQFDVILYADVAKPDEYSQRLRDYGSQWRSTLGLSDPELAQTVRDDSIDILVDLSGHTPGNRLLAFARKAAPIQVTANTTGMRTMDYRITDAHLDPPGTTEHLHSEKPLRLPDIYMAWRPPDGMPEPGPLPAQSRGFVTFGSFNSCFKITPAMVSTWSRILQCVHGSRLILLAFSSAMAVERVRALFAGQGIGAERLEFVGRLTFEEYFAIRRRVDIALDTAPFHGNTTTCDSLWMGLPVVALAGPTHFSRVGVSMLTNVGLPELIARDADEYVAIATRLAADMPRLAGLRAALRPMMLRSPNTDAVGCTRHLEAAYRRSWETWCRGRDG